MSWENNKYGGRDLKVVNPLRPTQKVTVYSIGENGDGSWAVAGEFDDFFCFGLESEKEARKTAEHRFASVDHMDVFMDHAHSCT